MMMGIGNATFWLLYGIALWDYVIMVPNGIGLLLGSAQLVVCLVFPKHTATATALPNDLPASYERGGDISMSFVGRQRSRSDSASGGIFADLTLKETVVMTVKDDNDETILG
jgi:Sugar efflux transporter for intercellular exchange